MPLRIALACSALGYEQGAGHLWAFLNWALGLRAMGCEVTWLEEDPGVAEPDLERMVTALQAQLRPYGLEDCIALRGPETVRRVGARRGGDRAVGGDLLLNMSYDVPGWLLERFARSALLDIDPGATQLWMATGALEIAAHDAYLTVGEGVAAGTARVPDAGVRWHHMPPCVSLEHWPPERVRGEAYTTITHWWGDEDWIELDGAWVENSKRSAYAKLDGLPRVCGVPLELALGGLDDEPEVARLRALGWRVADAWEVAATPQAYRAYVAGSRGELGAAKPAYTRLQTGWFSDRTACYLASGRPAIVQWTGPSEFLPSDEGVLRFRTPDEAAAAIASVEEDYERHAGAARAVAETHLDARKVTERLLEVAFT